MRLGRYLIQKKIATGGMAEIFLARDPRRSEPVVIKRILPIHDDNEELLSMFIDEARIAARLDHTNIARVYELGEDHGRFFIVMEYVPGDDLRRIAERGLKAKQFLPIPYAASIVAEAAKGFDYAHNCRDDRGQLVDLVHRDVSPQNILVSLDGIVKIVDFGIAKAANRISTTRTGQLKGKFGYMSPEQVLGKPLDHRSDIFALGTVLYELTVVKRLFRGANEIKTIGLVARADVEHPTAIRPEYPPELEEIVLRALAREPANRYQNMRTLCADLEAFLDRQGRPKYSDLAQYMRGLFPDRSAEASQAGVSFDDIVEEEDDPDVTTLWTREEFSSDSLAVNADPDPTVVSDGLPGALLADLGVSSDERRDAAASVGGLSVAGSAVKLAQTAVAGHTQPSQKPGFRVGDRMSEQDPIDNPFLAAKLAEAAGATAEAGAPELDPAQQQAIETATSAAEVQAQLVEQERSIIALQQQGHQLTAEQYGVLSQNYTAQAQALAQQGNALSYLGQLSAEETTALQTHQQQLMANAQAAATAMQQMQAAAAQQVAAQAAAAQQAAASAQQAAAAPAQPAAPVAEIDPNEDFEGDLAAQQKKSKTTLYVVIGVILLVAVGAYFAIGGSAIFDTVDSEVEEDPEKVAGEPEWTELPMEDIKVESDPPGARVVVNGFIHDGLTPTTVKIISDKANTIAVFVDDYYPLHQFVPYGTQHEGTIKLQLEKIPEPVPPAEGAEINIMDTKQKPYAELEVKTQNPEDNGATVFVDGKEVGVSPITVPVVRRATHHVMIQKEGKAPHIVLKTVLQPIDQISVQLTEGVYLDRYAEVLLEPAPPTAAAEFDGNPASGMTAVKYDKGEQVRVGVTMEGYEPWQYSIHTTPAGNFHLMPILKEYPTGYAGVLFTMPEGQYWYPCVLSTPRPVCWEGDIDKQKPVPVGKSKVKIFEQVGGHASDRRFSKNQPEIELEPNKAYVFEIDFSGEDATVTLVGEPVDWVMPEPGSETPADGKDDKKKK